MDDSNLIEIIEEEEISNLDILIIPSKADIKEERKSISPQKRKIEVNVLQYDFLTKECLG